MRFFTLLALLPLAFSLSTVITRRSTADPSMLARIAENKADKFVSAKGAVFTCEGFSTRKVNCQCRDGLIKPLGYKAGGQKPHDNCACGDVKNSVPYKNAKGWTKCSCPKADNDAISSNDQYYDYDINRCICESSCTEIRVKDVMTCVPDGPEPSPKPGQKGRRSLKAALDQRRIDKESRAVEDSLKCKISEKSCQVGNQWSCVEVMTSLATCGGCAGEAIDCGSLPNISEVHCSLGQCVVDSCAQGFKLTHPISAIGVSTTGSATCEPIRRHPSSLLSFQN